MMINSGHAQLAGSYQLSQEHQLPELMSEAIPTFWQTGKFSHLKGVNNVNIATAMFVNSNAKHSIVLSPGRAEGYLKYQELVFDLFNNGYNVFIIDHRGQGISQRLLSDSHKGYVDEFDFYAKDLDNFIAEITSTYKLSPPFLLAHSMGSAIALRAMQSNPHLVKAAVLSSPMIAINSGALPHWLAKVIISFGHLANQLSRKQPWYFLGQGPYQRHRFERNVLSHSAIRHSIFADLYHANKNIQLGGVTYHWLVQALKANHKILSQTHLLKTPLMIIQASEDTVVDNNAQNRFCHLFNQLNPAICPQIKPHIIQGAKHELFFEQDTYRNEALTNALFWFDQHK